MGENVGRAMAKPLLDKLGGEGGDGRRGEHGHSEERVVQKSRLGPNPLSTNAPGRTPVTPRHSHPTWQQFHFPPTLVSTQILSSRKATRPTVHKKYYSDGTDQQIAALSPHAAVSQSGPQGPIPRDYRCFATVVCFAGYSVSNGAKQWASKVTEDLQKLAEPRWAFRLTKGLGRSSRKFSRVLHLMVTSEPVRSSDGGVF